MLIKISYDGSTAKCVCTDYLNPNLWVNFNEADSLTQIQAMDAFRTIVNNWKREHNNEDFKNHMNEE